MTTAKPAKKEPVIVKGNWKEGTKPSDYIPKGGIEIDDIETIRKKSWQKQKLI